MDIFTRMIHGIRLKYAAVSVVFLAVAVGLLHLSKNHVFGWHDFLVVFVFVMMALTIFLMHGHYVSGPLEKMASEISRLKSQSLESQDAVRISWNGKDEFACLAASMNGLLESVQSRSLGLQEKNLRLKNIVACAEVELVVMNGNVTLLDVVHCPAGMEPVPGLARGCAPDSSVWGEKNLQSLKTAISSVCSGKNETQTAELSFRSAETNKTRRIKAFVRLASDKSFPMVMFRDEKTPDLSQQTNVRTVPLSHVAAGVARDLRSVFSLISRSADRYANSEKPEVRDTVSTIREAIRSGVTVMDNLLTLGGEKRMHLQSVTVQELVEEVKPVVADLTRDIGVRTEYVVADGGLRLMADIRQLRKVAEIIVRNSVEAFGAVPGRIEISSKAVELSETDGAGFYPQQKAGCGVLLRFEDDGPGMAENVLAHAFEPYCSTKGNGRGLGLAIADSIVEAHGGGMRFDVEKGVRTAVEVFLRFSERAADDVESLRKEFPGGEILVVDDNKSVLKITSALLRAQKIAAHVADCRADALRKFGELSERLRAVMLDAQLDAEKSVGVLQNMRSMNPRIPVIVVSGYAKDEIDEMFVESPPDGFLMKPYTVSELQNLLAGFPLIEVRT